MQKSGWMKMLLALAGHIFALCAVVGSGLPAIAQDETRWHYDHATGICTNKTYADGSSVAYTYTPDGKPRRTTWARGEWRENDYDLLGQLANVTYSSGTPSVTLARNYHGTVTNATDSSGLAYSFAVNVRQLVTNETVVSGAFTDTLTRFYDGRERLAGISLGNSYALQYAYDNESRIAVVSNAHFTTRCAYEDGYNAGHTTMLPNGNTLIRAVTRDPHRRHLITGVTNLFNGTVVSARAYGHDILGRIITRDNDTFCYNARSELTSATISANAYGYVFDPIGNRRVSSVNGAETVYTANELNQYTAVNAVAPTYDADGNVLTHGAFSFAWDAENRIVSAYSNNVWRLANAYDHRHRRIRKETMFFAHGYIWNGWNIVAETVSNKVSGTVYTDHNTWGVDLSGSMQGAGGVGGLLAVTRVSASGTQTFFPCYDGNGNITEYVDESGAVCAHYEYDAFGNIIAQSGDLADTFTHRFSTKPFDTETGLVIYELRPYIPPLGRWAARDMIEEEGGLNLYGFVGNDPLNRWDYLGLKECECPQERIDIMISEMMASAVNMTKANPVLRNVNPGGTTVVLRREYREYGGYVCCDKKTGKVSSTGPFPGTWRITSPDERTKFSDVGVEIEKARAGGPDVTPTMGNIVNNPGSRCGHGLTAVAFYHSHPAEETLSRGDRGFAKKYGIPIAGGAIGASFYMIYDPAEDYDRSVGIQY